MKGHSRFFTVCDEARWRVGSITLTAIDMEEFQAALEKEHSVRLVLNFAVKPVCLCASEDKGDAIAMFS